MLVFPSVDAVSLNEYISDSILLSAAEMTDASVSDTADHERSYSMTVVFIDCTWYQVHKISTDPRLSSKFCLSMVYGHCYEVNDHF